MRTILAIIIMLFATQASAADFAFSTKTIKKDLYGLERNITIASIELTGQIQKGDYKEYLDTYEWVSTKYDLVTSIKLNSDGGLVDEAMLIGKHVRSNRLTTYVDEKKSCYSSCALIHLSGLSRVSIGKVGVHRSYFKKGTNLSFDELEESLGDSHEKIIKFLREMRVFERIIEDFITTASTEIKLLGEVPNDRLYDEYIISKCGPRPKIERKPLPELTQNMTKQEFDYYMKVTKYNQELWKVYYKKLTKYLKCEYPVKWYLQIDAQNK